MPSSRYYVDPAGPVLRRGADTVIPGSTPGPPPSGGLYRPAYPIFGSSCGVPQAANQPSELSSYKGKTRGQLWDQLQTEYATLSGNTHSSSAPLMKACHGYDGDIPTTYTQLDAVSAFGAVSRNLVVVNNIKAPHGQVGAGLHDAAITSLVQSWTGDETLYLGVNHEPENDSGYGATMAANWRADQARLAWLITTRRGSNRVVPFCCVINWEIHPNNKSGAGEWDNPAPEMLALGVDLDQVVYTTDGYDTSPINIGGAENLFEPTSDRAAGWGFTRFGVSETACKSYSTSSPNDRSLADDWMRELARLAVARRFEYVLWFASGVGGRADQTGLKEGWWIYGDTPKAQWGDICAGSYP